MVPLRAEVIQTGFEFPNLLELSNVVYYPPIYFKTFARVYPPAVLDGWTLTGGSVDIVRHIYPTAAEGDQSLDLNGVDAGTITREFPTVPGTRYTLSFKHSGNPIGGYPSQITVSVDDEVIATLDWDPLVEANDYQINMRFKCAMYTFTATKSVTRIAMWSSFPGMFGASSGPELDDIRFGPENDPDRISPPTVGGLIWSDLNANGVRDSDEAVLPDVTVNLVTPGGIRSTKTDGLGRFSFDDPGPRSAFQIVVIPPPFAVPTFDPDGLETPNTISGSVIDDCTLEFGYLIPRVQYVYRDPVSGELATESNQLVESLPYPTCSLEVTRQEIVSLGTPDAPQYGLSVDLVVRLTDTLGELPEFSKLGLDTVKFLAGGRLLQTLTNLSALAKPVNGEPFWRVRDSALELPVSLVIDRLRPGPVTLMVRTDGNQQGRRAQAAVTFTVNREALWSSDADGNYLVVPGALPSLDPFVTPGISGEEQGLRPYAIRLLVPQAFAAEAVNRAKVRWQLNGTDLRLVTSSDPDPSFSSPGMASFYFRTGVGTTADRFLFGEKFEPRFCPKGVYAAGQVDLSLVLGGVTTSVDRRPILKDDRGPVDPVVISLASAVVGTPGQLPALTAAALDSATGGTTVTAAASSAAAVTAAPKYTLADVFTCYYLLYQEPGLQILDWFLEGRDNPNVDVPPVQPTDLIRVGRRATVQLGNVKGAFDWDGWKLNFTRAKATKAVPTPPLRGSIVIERDFPNAAKAAVALSEALQSLKGAATPLEFNLDLATLDRLMEESVSGNTDGTEINELVNYWRFYTFASMREPMAALEQALEFGVTLNPIAGGVIGLSYAYDEYRAGNDLKAGLQAAMSVLPVVGMAGRGGLKLAALEISVFAADLTVPALAPVVVVPQSAALTTAAATPTAAAAVAGSKYLRAKVFLQGPARKAFIPIARRFNQDIRYFKDVAAARVQMMASIQELLTLPVGQAITLQELEAMVHAGLVPILPKDTSRKYAKKLFQFMETKEMEVHHWLPLQHEAKFLANGIDPNQMEFLDPLFKSAHRPMHNAPRFAPGGPLNAAWDEFFKNEGGLPGPQAILEQLQRIVDASLLIKAVLPVPEFPIIHSDIFR